MPRSRPRKKHLVVRCLWVGYFLTQVLYPRIGVVCIIIERMYLFVLEMNGMRPPFQIIFSVLMVHCDDVFLVLFSSTSLPTYMML